MKRLPFTSTRYRIVASLGKGGMGEVFRARDTLLERDVALKVLAQAEGPDPLAATKKLLREARLGAALKHPNIITIHDLGEADGVAFIVMELVEGVSLRRRMAAPASVDRKLSWLADVATALEAAHRQSLVHRDIKPENVMVTEQGLVKVLDFGIAKFHGLHEIPTSSAVAASTLSGITGTPMYMAPEQWVGVVDARSDQYSWGLVAYEVLAGVHPKLPDGRPREGRPQLTEMGVPISIARAIEMAMEPDPSHRHASLASIVRLLRPHASRDSAGMFATGHVAAPSPTAALHEGTVAGDPDGASASPVSAESVARAGALATMLAPESSLPSEPQGQQWATVRLGGAPVAESFTTARPLSNTPPVESAAPKGSRRAARLRIGLASIALAVALVVVARQRILAFASPHAAAPPPTAVAIAPESPAPPGSVTSEVVPEPAIVSAVASTSTAARAGGASAAPLRKSPGARPPKTLPPSAAAALPAAVAPATAAAPAELPAPVATPPPPAVLDWKRQY